MTASIENYPLELLSPIFTCLEKKTLFACAQVSSSWHFEAVRIISHAQKLNSNDELVDAIQRFANRVTLGQCARFLCIIGKGKDYKTIDIEIKASEDPLEYVGDRPHCMRLSALRYNIFNPKDMDFKETYFIDNIGNGSLSLRKRYPFYQPKTDIFAVSFGYQAGKGEIGAITDVHGAFMTVTRSPFSSGEDMLMTTLHILGAKFDLLQGQVVRRRIKKCILITGLVLSSCCVYLALYNVAQLVACAVSTIIFFAIPLLALHAYAYAKGLAPV